MSWWPNLFQSRLERQLAASFAARARHWSSVGKTDTDCLAQAIPSRFLAGIPVWPSGRETFLVIRRATTIVLATDGMSDPDEGVFAKRNGLGIELFIEAPAHELAAPIGSSYLHVLTQAARNLVDNPEFLERWPKFQILSMALPAPDGEQRLVDTDGNHIVFFGMPGYDLSAVITGMPLSPTRVMAVTLVHPADFAKVASLGSAGRQKLAAAMAAAGFSHTSDMNRGPLLE